MLFQPDFSFLFTEAAALGLDSISFPSQEPLGQSHGTGNCDPGEFLSLFTHSKCISLVFFPSKENAGKWGLKAPAGTGWSFRIPLSMEWFFWEKTGAPGVPEIKF